MEGSKRILLYSVAVLIGIFFLIWGLIEAQGILAPLISAIILALVMLPMARWMEKGVRRGVSSIISTLVFLLISVGFAVLLIYQVKVFVDSWPEIKQTMEPKIEQWKTFIVDNTFINDEDFPTSESIAESGDESEEGAQAIKLLGLSTGFLGLYLLTLVYIFFMLNFRYRFKMFLLKLFADEKKEEVSKIIQDSAVVAQQYLVGKLILMVFLAVAYSIGLGISGVSNYILIGILSALFTIVPFVGNIAGLVLALAFGYLTSGEIGVLIGILITFAVVQFLETYVLQPFVLGDKVGVHPFFVIFSLIVGNAIWGVIGMILAIPIMAIITVVFLHVPALQPFGYLFSNKKS